MGFPGIKINAKNLWTPINAEHVRRARNGNGEGKCEIRKMGFDAKPAQLNHRLHQTLYRLHKGRIVGRNLPIVFLICVKKNPNSISWLKTENSPRSSFQVLQVSAKLLSLQASPPGKSDGAVFFRFLIKR